MYKDAMDDSSNALGLQTFQDITRLMTKQGQATIGLSTYYVHMQDCAQTFMSMLQRLKSIVAEFDEDDTVTSAIVDIESTYNNLHQFLLWSFANLHLDFESSDRCHCCVWALAGICTITHDATGCTQCARIFTFFATDVTCLLVDTIVPRIAGTEDKGEIASMVESMPMYTDSFTSYAAHRLRAKI